MFDVTITRNGDIERVGSERGRLGPEGLVLKRAQGASGASDRRERLGPASEIRGEGTTVGNQGGGQNVIGVIGVGNRLTHRLRRWKQIGGHEEQKGIMACWFKREGDLVDTEERRPPVVVRLLVLNECIREEGDQGGELVDPLRPEGMVCCCDGELKKPRESERGGWLAARSLRGMWVRMGWSGIRN